MEHTEIKNKKLKGWHWVLIILSISWIIVQISSKSQTTEDSAKSESQAAYRKKQQARLDSLETVQYNVEQAFKQRLRDPESYERIEWDIYHVTPKKGSKVYAQMWIKYRAKNGFGGYSIETHYWSFNNSFDVLDEWNDE